MGTRVYIGGLDYDVLDHEVERFFKNYGEIREIILKRGFGFVEFANRIDADDAVHELNGKLFQKRRVTVDFARPMPRRRGAYGSSGNYNSRVGGGGSSRRSTYKLIVLNLSSRVGRQELRTFMREAGEVIDADAHNHRRNEGEVDFATRADRKNAIKKLDDVKLHGRRLKLVEYEAHRSRSRSVSRSRSRRKRNKRSRSKSRSRSISRSRSRSRSVSGSSSSSRSVSGSSSSSKSSSKSCSRSVLKRKSRLKSSPESSSGSQEVQGILQENLKENNNSK